MLLNLKINIDMKKNLLIILLVLPNLNAIGCLSFKAKSLKAIAFTPT
jgi:hypothetical protein